jgi:hypothetical protein
MAADKTILQINALRLNMAALDSLNSNPRTVAGSPNEVKTPRQASAQSGRVWRATAMFAFGRKAGDDQV